MPPSSTRTATWWICSHCWPAEPAPSRPTPGERAGLEHHRDGQGAAEPAPNAFVAGPQRPVEGFVRTDRQYACAVRTRPAAATQDSTVRVTLRLPHKYAQPQSAANVRICRGQVFLDCRGAGILVRGACRTVNGHQ